MKCGGFGFFLQTVSDIMRAGHGIFLLVHLFFGGCVIVTAEGNSLSQKKQLNRENGKLLMQYDHVHRHCDMSFRIRLKIKKEQVSGRTSKVVSPPNK